MDRSRHNDRKGAKYMVYIGTKCESAECGEHPADWQEDTRRNGLQICRLTQKLSNVKPKKEIHRPGGSRWILEKKIALSSVGNTQSFAITKLSPVSSPKEKNPFGIPPSKCQTDSLG